MLAATNMTSMCSVDSSVDSPVGGSVGGSVGLPVDSSIGDSIGGPIGERLNAPAPKLDQSQLQPPKGGGLKQWSPEGGSRG